MGFIKKITGFFTKPFRKKEYPVHAHCSVCGERVYLPFFCDHCHKYFCGKHRLPFDHDCENIEDWKKRPDSPPTYRK